MRILFFFLILGNLFIACKKESFTTSPDAQVTITQDSLKFDTVFTTTGSITKSFRIINENDQKLRLSSVKLMGGINSPFHINADGFPGPDINNIEIEANDSIHVFVSVSVDPSVANLPFILRDSIQIVYNGTERFVQLEAWGQNAHFFRNKMVTGTETWNNDLPYVILGSLIVDTNATLIINKGCRVYVHADAPLLIDGTLVINGEKDTADRVKFQGDRLDEPYRSFPAGWPGIYFRGSSKDNVLTYAMIRNAYQAVAVTDPSPNANPKLILNECIIDNAYDAGLIAVNSSITARNTLISNCGKNVVFVKGGNYDLTHCTVVSYSNSFMLHRDPVLLVTNFITVNNVPVTQDLTATFRNCIFWGDNGTVDDEVIVVKSGTTVFNVTFNNILWKVQNPPANVTSSGIIANQNPQFDSVNISHSYFDFHLKDTSPAVNAGINAFITIDLDGKPRPVGLPDLGSYERQ